MQWNQVGALTPGHALRTLGAPWPTKSNQSRNVQCQSIGVEEGLPSHRGILCQCRHCPTIRNAPRNNTAQVQPGPDKKSRDNTIQCNTTEHNTTLCTMLNTRRTQHNTQNTKHKEQHRRGKTQYTTNIHNTQQTCTTHNKKRQDTTHST